MKEVAKSCELSTTNSDARARAPKLEVLHATDSHFQNVFDYKTYRLLNKSQTYDGKMVARTGKNTKRMETLIKVYKFDDKVLITISRFIAQFKRARNSNEVSEGKALWIMPVFMTSGPASR